MMLHQMTHVLSAAEASGAPVSRGQPLLVYDPDCADEALLPGGDKSMSKVYVEPFIADKLRPHQASL